MIRYLGIDCGLDGAIVSLDGDRILDKISMPTIKESKKRSIDIESLSAFFNSPFKRDCCIAIVEDPGPHAPTMHGVCPEPLPKACVGFSANCFGILLPTRFQSKGGSTCGSPSGLNVCP